MEKTVKSIEKRKWKTRNKKEIRNHTRRKGKMKGKKK